MTYVNIDSWFNALGQVDHTRTENLRRAQRSTNPSLRWFKSCANLLFSVSLQIPETTQSERLSKSDLDKRSGYHEDVLDILLLGLARHGPLSVPLNTLIVHGITCIHFPVCMYIPLCLVDSKP